MYKDIGHRNSKVEVAMQTRTEQTKLNREKI